MKKKTKIILISIASFVGVASLVLGIPFIIFAVKSGRINTSYSYLKEATSYSQKVEITTLNLVTQHVSCGYATIEMMSDYYGHKVTEDELASKNGGRISTQSTNGFTKEINASISNKSFVQKTYLNNDVFLKEIHDSLSNSNPVAIEWAAKYEGAWTLHFSIVTGLDIGNDIVTIYNPYGYIENITVDSFISRTTFSEPGSIPFFLSFGFAFGSFHKNTLFYAK